MFLKILTCQYLLLLIKVELNFRLKIEELANQNTKKNLKNIIKIPLTGVQILLILISLKKIKISFMLKDHGFKYG